MRIKSALLSLSIVAACGVAHATPILLNGSFESTTSGNNKKLSATAGTTGLTTLTGWRSSDGNDGGYNFVLDSKIATTTDSVLALRGQKNGFTASPDGGNFFASDALYHPGTLSQSITGLAIGGIYTVKFYYALAQQTGYYGANTNNYWEVGIGNTKQNSGMLSIADGGFSGWKIASMNFTATSASEVLSFLAKTNSPGAPPFMLLDGVSVANAVPEPSTTALVLGGLGLLGLVARRRRATAQA